MEIRIYPVSEEELKEIFFNPFDWKRVITYGCYGLLFAEGLNDLANPAKQTIPLFDHIFLYIPILFAILGFITMTYGDLQITKRRRDAIKHRLTS